MCLVLADLLERGEVLIQRIFRIKVKLLQRAVVVCEVSWRDVPPCLERSVLVIFIIAELVGNVGGDERGVVTVDVSVDVLIRVIRGCNGMNDTAPAVEKISSS